MEQLINDSIEREVKARAEVEALKREIELQKVNQMKEVELLKIAYSKEVEALKRGLLTPGSIQEVVQSALKEERERVAREASEAKFRKDQRSIWLRSPECILKIFAFVAMNGYCARNFSSLSRAFRGDPYMWAAIKDRCGAGGKTCLMFHADRGDLARVQWLIKRAANVNAATRGEGMTPLMYASMKGHLQIVKKLCDSGANVNAAQTDDGYTSLMWASMHGNLEVVRELCVRGANVNAAETDGWTSLMWASQRGHLEVVRELCVRGANLNAAWPYSPDVGDL